MDLNTVLQSVRISHDPHASQSDRLQAFNIFEQLKVNFDLSLSVINAILFDNNTLAHDDIFVHFAIHLTESLVTCNWNNLPQFQKDALKNKAFEFLRYVC